MTDYKRLFSAETGWASVTGSFLGSITDATFTPYAPNLATGQQMYQIAGQGTSLNGNFVTEVIPITDSSVPLDVNLGIGYYQIHLMRYEIEIFNLFYQSYAVNVVPSNSISVYVDYYSDSGATNLLSSKLLKTGTIPGFQQRPTWFRGVVPPVPGTNYIKVRAQVSMGSVNYEAIKIGLYTFAPAAVIATDMIEGAFKHGFLFSGIHVQDGVGTEGGIFKLRKNNEWQIISDGLKFPVEPGLTNPNFNLRRDFMTWVKQKTPHPRNVPLKLRMPDASWEVVAYFGEQDALVGSYNDLRLRPTALGVASSNIQVELELPMRKVTNTSFNTTSYSCSVQRYAPAPSAVPPVNSIMDGGFNTYSQFVPQYLGTFSIDFLDELGVSSSGSMETVPSTFNYFEVTGTDVVLKKYPETIYTRFFKYNGVNISAV